MLLVLLLLVPRRGVPAGAAGGVVKQADLSLPSSVGTGAFSSNLFEQVVQSKDDVAPSSPYYYSRCSRRLSGALGSLYSSTNELC